MPSSMTGFGRGIAKTRYRKYIVEAKSLNSRYCEVRVTAPKDFLEVEHRVTSMIRSMFSRGKFDLVLKYEDNNGNSRRTFDEEEIVERWNELERIRKKLGISKPISLERVISLPKIEREPQISDQCIQHFLKATEMALSKLHTFRMREGQALILDVHRRVGFLEKAVKRIARRAKAQKEAKWSKMKERVQKLLNAQDIDEQRVAQEIAILVEKTDVTEEIVRLSSHLKRLRELSKSKDAVGRKMDFLIQEINREVNTIGSKATDFGISEDVLEMKSETEKIREQVQNLE